MENSSKKENTQNFLHQHQGENIEQMKFASYDQQVHDHNIIKDILSNSQEDDMIKDSLGEEESEDIAFEDFLKEGVDTSSNLIEISSQAPLDIPMQAEPEQTSHEQLVQEVQEMVKFEESLDDIDTIYGSLPSVDDTVVQVKKGTQKAFYVLKDMFGDIETEEDKLAAQEYEVSSRKKLGALFLAVTLGFIGGHRLYLGHYKKVPIYLGMIFFWYTAKEFLPDLGLANLLSTVMIFWIVADILAILFSHKIRDAKNRVVEDWI